MKKNKPTTEQTSHYDDLEHMSTFDLLTNINKEDKTIPAAIEKVIPRIEILVDTIVDKMKQGGRLFYIGAGTSGRLGVLDASECPPTFGVPFDWVIGIIAGGDGALRVAVENAEDNPTQAFRDLMAFSISSNDILIGIAASGTTPYVIGGLKEANKKGITTACITCSAQSPLAAVSKHPIEVIVGPEFLTGSTRMKAGTAQKQVLNMISTSVMIKLGKVQGNKMVDMRLSNIKLVARGTRMIMEELNIDETEASALLQAHKSVRKAIEFYNK
ncbi:MAG: N-acetylmuramic acid 6-phosphate etherase [Flavobacteriaceae bacterium]|nr:MAG: N-acetylmuramic acid 6-phosphate etherase [Flavobacteriaceae bacterium]